MRDSKDVWTRRACPEQRISNICKMYLVLRDHPGNVIDPWDQRSVLRRGLDTDIGATTLRQGRVQFPQCSHHSGIIIQLLVHLS